MGESEKTLRQVFKKAKQASPCLLFFDGLDALAPVRRASDNGVSERLVGQFLSELDNLTALDEAIVLGATNRLDLVDPVLLRPGRFDFVIDCPLPDRAARLEMLRVHVRDIPLAADVSLDELALLAEGLIGADIEAVCQRASMEMVREFIVKHGVGGDLSACADELAVNRAPLLFALQEAQRRKHALNPPADT